MKPSRTLILAACLILAAGLGIYLGNQREVMNADGKAGAVASSPTAVVINADPAEKTPLTVQGASAPLAGVVEVTSWSVMPPNPAPLKAGETIASRQVRAVGLVKAGALPSLESLKQGQRILLPVRTGAPVAGVVNLVMHDEEGWTRVGGALEDGAKGSFSLGQKGAKWVGSIRHASRQTAYVIETAETGEIRLLEKPIGSVVCQAIPRRKPPVGAGGAAAEAVSGQDASVTAVSPVIVPALDSLPSATHVVYIDFDGELVNDPDWNGGFAINALPSRLGSGYITTAQMTEVWKRVAEDMRPFNISVTTILSRYTSASPGQRMRCIVTSTDVAAPGAGGVAYLGSYDEAGSAFSSDIPSWAFTASYYIPDYIAGTISHEVGHTFGLSHDGRFDVSSPNYEEYYDGHGSGATSWGPIMGTTYDRVVSQWSKGEYASASNTEDDLSIIGNAANGFFVRTDDAANGLPATALPNTGIFDKGGIITSAADVDLYSFGTNGGSVTINATPAAVGPNLDILLELRGPDGVTVLKSSNPAGLAKATITFNITTPDTYFIAVRSSGSGTASTGYTTYGSIGEYTLSGTFAAVPDVAPLITTDPLSQAVVPGTKVTFSVVAVSNTAPTYQWTKDNVNLAGQTKNTLVITSAQVANQGAYRCIVTNSKGSTPSEPATLTINYKPVFTLHPVAKTTDAGTPVSFTVAAHGTPVVGFQWQHNGIDIPLATSDTLTLTDPQWANLGRYRCVASNMFGSTISKEAILTVRSKPVILVQPPVTFLAPLNGATSVGLTAAGTGTLSYQWFKGATKLTGQTRAALSLSGINAGTAGAYFCVVKNTIGETSSDPVNVIVQDAPVITRDLLGATVARGTKRTLSVAVVGAPPLAYEWRKDGIKVPGTTASLVVTAVADADYQVIVTNGFGQATSALVHLSVHDVPKIVTKPVAQTRAFGGTATFNVVASGTPVLAYQWKKNNLPMIGQNSDTLALSGLVAGDAASYSVTVSNAVGSVTSVPVKLTLQIAPSVVNPPVAATVDAFAPVSFSVTATGTATLKYQWQIGTTDIPGATAATYKIASAQTSNNGMYRVKVSNLVGEVFSVPVQLTVNAVVAPSVSDFTPKLGKAGHYVRVLGANLNWTTGVNFRTSAAAVVKAAFVIVSPNELLVTVPVGAASSPITVTTRGGVADTGTFFSVTSVNDTNDDFVNARVIPGAGGKLSGNNTLFSGQIGEERHAMEDGYPEPADFDPIYSAWFEWTPAVSGSYYISTRGSAFDTRVAVYEGATLTGLTLVGYNDDEDYDRDIYTSRAYVVVEAGTTYHIAIDGFNFMVSFDGDSFEVDERGAYVVNVTKIAASSLVASSSTEGAWVTQGPAVASAGGTVELGGNQASAPALAWLRAAPAAGGSSRHAAVRMTYASTTGTRDVFGINAYGTNGQPLFGVLVDAASGDVRSMDALGNVQSTGQTMIPGEAYDVDVWADLVARTWGVCLNGIWICKGMPFPEHGEFSDFAAQWLPGGGQRSRVILHSVEVTSEAN